MDEQGEAMIDYGAVVEVVRNNWDEFLSACGLNFEIADATLQEIEYIWQNQE